MDQRKTKMTTIRSEIHQTVILRVFLEDLTSSPRQHSVVLEYHKMRLVGPVTHKEHLGPEIHRVYLEEVGETKTNRDQAQVSSVKAHHKQAPLVV
jgi:hypothetical protein